MARTKRYPGSIAKRGAKWRVRLCVAGQYHSFTVDGTKTDAQNFATEKHVELTAKHERAREGRREPPRFSELWREFEDRELPALAPGTQTSYRNSWKAFEPFFVGELGDPRVNTISRGDVRRFMAWRRTFRVGKDEGSVSDHTVARDFRVLRRLLNYALDMEDIEANPCTRMKPRKADPRDYVILSDDQFEALLNACGDHPMLRTYLVLLDESGARSLTEAARLEWTDLDFQDGGWINIRSAPGRRTKSGKSRWVPMTPRLREALQEHAARFRMAVYDGKRSPFVFHHTRARRDAKAGERVRSFRTAITRAARDAKLPAGWRIHDLRHRRVTTWLADGASAVLVKEAVGHSSLSTTLGYTHLARKHLGALRGEPAVEERKVEQA